MDWLALYNRNLLQAELEKIRKTGTSLSESSRCRLINQQLQLLDRIIWMPDRIRCSIEQVTTFPAELFSLVESMDPIDSSVTAALIVRNEERSIINCLQHLITVFDEIVILDTGSTDGTVEKIRSCLDNSHGTTIRLYYSKWNDDFASARNTLLQYIQTSWVFFVDADEYIVSTYDDLHNMLNALELFPIHDLIYCPKIIDADGNETIGVQRIFKKKLPIKYFGNVHEEPRLLKDDHHYHPVKSVSLDIQLNHDGYTKSVYNAKDKAIRNLTLIKKAMELEPGNVRWMFFYIRDNENILPPDEIIQTGRRVILMDRSGNINIENLVERECTYQILSILARTYMRIGDKTNFDNCIALLNKVHPGSSDAIYYRYFVTLNEIIQEKEQALKELLSYRKTHLSPQYGSMRSNGEHIDFLLGCFLAETGHYGLAKKYIDFTERIYSDNPIFEYYKKMICNYVLCKQNVEGDEDEEK